MRTNGIRSYIRIWLEVLRCFPHLILFYVHKNRNLIQADTRRWLELMKLGFSTPLGFIYLLSCYREFRNVFYFRIGTLSCILNLICPKLSSLYIMSGEIGAGFFIRHGFATAIGAKSIGKNFTVYQQVTIGDYLGDYPVILDNVTIKTGAIAIGNIKIGNNVVIGANTTVMQNVPDNCTVYPPMCMKMRWSRNEKCY